jgi:hypothetical protein
MIAARCVALAVAFVLAPWIAGCPPPSAEPDAGVVDERDAGPDEEPDAGLPDSGPGVVVDVASFCADFHGAVCDGFASCGCSLDGRAFDLDDCAATRAAACEQALAAVPPLVPSAAGVDSAATSACLGAVASLVDRCAIVNETTLPQQCASFVVENVALGGACVLTNVIARCANGFGICNAGTCVALPGEGEPCAGGLFCAAPSSCSKPFADDGVCSSENVDPPPLGELGALCAATAECAAGLACVDGACASAPARGDACGGSVCGNGDACVRDDDERVCGARAALGESCVPTDQRACVDGLYCDVDTCAPLPAEGEACGPSLECAAPTLCDADNGFLCVVPPDAGEPCLIGSALCAIGLGCNVDNVCAVGPGVGEACLFPNNLCADGLACDFTFDGSFCAERRGEGGACQNDVVCDDGLFCGNGGTCTPTLATGAPCPTGGGCSAGDQCNDLGDGFTCQPEPDAVDEPCLDVCVGDLTCTGLGGSCAPALCASP